MPYDWEFGHPLRKDYKTLNFTTVWKYLINFAMTNIIESKLKTDEMVLNMGHNIRQHTGSSCGIEIGRWEDR